MWRTEEHALSQEPQSPLHFVMSKQGVGADKCCFSPYLSPRLRGFPAGSNGEESACSAGNMGSIPGLGRSPGEGMATHSSVLAWRIPWTEDPIQSMASQRVRHD